MEFDSFLNLDFISCFSVAEWLDDNTDYAWGIFKNDELIGYCTIGIADDMDAIVESHPEHTVDSLCISDVYIEKRYRHKGYGTQLIAEVIHDRWKLDGCKNTVYLSVLHDELTSFYSKIGFKPLDEPDGNFSGDMVLSISDGRVPRHRSDCTAWVCTTPKVEISICSRCHAQDSFVQGKALGHKWSKWKLSATSMVKKKPKKTRVCSRCHKKETVYIK